MDAVLLGARLALAIVFALAAVTKFLDRAGSRRAVADFGISPSLAGPLSLALPCGEAAIAVALLPARSAPWGAAGACVLLLLFLAGIGFNLAQGKTPDCHCFGQLYSEPIGARTVVRNVALAVLAGFVLVAGYGHPGLDAFSWLIDLTGVERLALALGVLALLASVAQWFLLLHPPRRLAGRLPMLGASSMVEAPPVARRTAPISPDEPRLPGLPVGSRAPRFRLRGLHGETMTLDALRAGGRAVILIFVSPSCGPCAALMPDLARWQVEYAGALRFVLISSGTLEDNRVKAEEHGIVELLVQKHFEVGTVYGVDGTPGAVIVYPDGTIGSPVAGGADQIRALLDQYIELVATQVGVELADEGELERALRQAANPLELGAAAPDLQFTGLDGSAARLSKMYGRKIALLFWSTNCGFCQQFEPALASWEQDRPVDAPDILIVLSEAARESSPVHLSSRVVIDRDGVAATALHCSGTPTAVLIDERGNIASQPAIGADAIRPMLGLPSAAATSPPIPLLERAPERPMASTSGRNDPVRIGHPLPDASLIDVRGGKVRLSDLRGRDTVLLFWSSTDPAGRRLVPDIQTWEERHGHTAPELVVVVSDSAAEKQIVQFGARVLIDRGGAAAEALGVRQTPTGIALDGRGRVAAGYAIGERAVLELLEDVTSAGAGART